MVEILCCYFSAVFWMMCNLFETSERSTLKISRVMIFFYLKLGKKLINENLHLHLGVEVTSMRQGLS